MNKNKKKIKKSVARRFKVTKTGKVMFSHQNVGHRKSHKNKRQIRRNNVKAELTGEFGKKIRTQLGK
ncbi:50S ribosomal protein L35 [Candidatus Dojkabacteria bacterium]|uniref:50S ribosomal protein L35 n=1 Tax=Candidatus Dojkabacteria bacterium TaxID=2099670 RepID=A0A5C7J4P1_9BACT|nr:MAG: 50S ribosomal protein L35 [Candidatus Dojkabacteria bacterium]